MLQWLNASRIFSGEHPESTRYTYSRDNRENNITWRCWHGMPKTEAPLAIGFPPPLFFSCDSRGWSITFRALSAQRAGLVFQVLITTAEDPDTGEHLESLRLSNHTGQIRLCHTQVGKSAHFAGWMT